MQLTYQKKSKLNMCNRFKTKSTSNFSTKLRIKRAIIFVGRSNGTE